MRACLWRWGGALGAVGVGGEVLVRRDQQPRRRFQLVTRETTRAGAGAQWLRCLMILGRLRVARGRKVGRRLRRLMRLASRGRVAVGSFRSMGTTGWATSAAVETGGQRVWEALRDRGDQ